jgi:co-chaperonin GroES (HSP10)
MGLFRRRTTGKVEGLRAVGHSVLVELLTAQETLGTQLTVGDNTKVEAPQAYVLDVGPGVKKDEWGFKVGDRVIFSGGFVPAPNFDKNPRQRGTIDPHSIKAVLVEGDE